MRFLHHSVLILALSVSALAQLPVVFPEQPLHPLQADHMGVSASWEAYLGTHPGTRIMDWDRYHPYPHRVLMSQSPLEGGHVKSAEDLDSRLRSFMSKHADLLCQSHQVGKLRARQLTLHGQVWYADYQLVVDGMALQQAEVNFRVSEEGHLLLMGSDLPVDYSLNATRLSAAQLERACYELPSEALAISSVELDEELQLLPRYLKSGWTFEPVRHATVRLDSPEEIYEVWLSANDARLLMSYNRVRHVEMTGRMMLECELEQPSDPSLVQPLSYAYVTVGGVGTSTDADGYFTVNLQGEGPWSLSTELRGFYADANRTDGADADFTSQLSADGQVFTLTEDDAHIAELDGYASTNRVHKYIKDMDSSFTLLDSSLPVNVNINATCNAYWDGSSINFYREGGGCPNTAQLAGVLYHEYGHGINDRVYQQAGVGGMANASLHEGLADATAVLQMDVDYVAPGWALRDLSNTLHYPEDMQGESHADGRFMGGAIWDARLLTGDIDLISNLVHFARWGTADDVDLGRCYFDYFLEVLVVDDDDGDLGNLTPHFAQLNEAFNNHGIGTDLAWIGAELYVEDDVPFFQMPMEDLPLHVQLSLPTILQPEGIQLVWWTSDADTQYTPCVQLEDGWEGVLPGQALGTMVSLYLDVLNSLDQVLRLPADAPESVYRVTYGYADGLLLDFEDEDGAAEGDGVWAWGEPQSGPWGAHSGDRVWATNLSGHYEDFSLHQLIFPSQVVESDQRAIIHFHHWYAIEEGWDGANCQISINEGPWQNITPVDGYDFTTPESNIWSYVPAFNGYSDGWVRDVLDLTELVEPGDEVALCFNLFSDGEVTAPGWYIDDLQYLGFASPASIQHEPLCDSEDLTQTSFEIYATLSTAIPVDSFLLRYRVDGGETQDVEMLPDSTQLLYHAAIPGPFNDQSIDYRLEVSNTVGFFSSLPAGEDWFSFRVGADTTPPVTVFVEAPHDLIGHTGRFDIQAEAYDNLGVNQVWLERSSNGSEWEFVADLQCDEEAGVWTYELALDEATEDELFFRLGADDQAQIPNAGHSDTVQISLGQYQFIDNFPEYQTEFWSLQGGWTAQDMRVHEGEWALGTSDTGFYSANDNSTAELDYDFCLVGAPDDVCLELWECWFLEQDDDFVFVEVSTDQGSSWNTVATRTGGSTWHNNQISLGEFVGEETLRIRFRLFSDFDTNGLNVGYYVDELSLVDGALDVAAPLATPEAFRLGTPYPNPFNPVCHLSLSLPQQSQVHARLYNLRGELVHEILRGTLAAGDHDLEVDGAMLASGVYLLSVQVGGEMRVQRLLLLK